MTNEHHKGTCLEDSLPRVKKPKPPYDSHDSLVAEIAKLKASFSQQRIDNLLAEMEGYQHQIKVLSDRHNKDVETMERNKVLANALIAATECIEGDLEGVDLSAVEYCADALLAFITGEQG